MIILQHSKLRPGVNPQQQQTTTGNSSIAPSAGSTIRGHHQQNYLADWDILLDLSNTDGIQARAFPIPNTTSFPCFLSNERWASQQPTKRGFLFLKPYKTASSTAAGIHLRIAKHVAQRQFQGVTTNDDDVALSLERHYNDRTITPAAAAASPSPLFCESRFDHGYAHHLFPRRNKNQSFLWSIVRDPQSRLLSLFFHFWVSRYGHKATTASFIDFAQRDFWDSQEHYLKVLSTRESSFQKYVARVAAESGRREAGGNGTTTLTIAKSGYVNQILLDYDFLAITERLDESAVVLAMLLDLPLGDVLYLSAKGQGGYDDGGFRHQCTRIQKTVVTDGMRDFFQTPEWTNVVYWDEVLYRMANASLDKTIDETLGRARFEQQLQTFRSVLAVSRTRCLETVIFPCSANGTRIPDNETDCLWRDSGCGYHCLNQVAREFGIHGHATAPCIHENVHHLHD
jgi:Galactose-3-O-sulfotransferase